MEDIGMKAEDVTISVSQALSTLQHHFAKQVMQRAEWDDEKSNFISQISRLDGENKALENMNKILLTRIKMLEYALLQERRKNRGATLEVGVKAKIFESGQELPSLDFESSVKSHKDTIRMFMSEMESFKFLEEIELSSKQEVELDSQKTEEAGVPAPKPEIAVPQLKREEQLVAPEPLIDDSASLEETPPTKEKPPEKVMEKDDVRKMANELLPDSEISEGHLDKIMKLASKYDKRTRKRATDIFGQDETRKEKDAESKEEKKPDPEAEAKANILGELVDLELEDHTNAGFDASNQADQRQWKPKFVFRSHFDAVRSLAFDENENFLVSGSEDMTVKMWNLALSGQSKKRSSLPDFEPIYTFRGHKDWVNTVALHAEKKLMASGSSDNTVRLWGLPKLNADPYAEYGKSNIYCKAVIDRHSDAVWQVMFSPFSETMFTASADGTVKCWNFNDIENPLLVSEFVYPSDLKVKNDESMYIPTTIDISSVHSTLLTVGFNNNVIVFYDLETGTPISHCMVDGEIHGPDKKTQMNKLISHSENPLVVSVHENKYIHFIDSQTCKNIKSVVGHKDAVASVATDPSKIYFATAGHDSSIRFWDIRKYACVQEMAAHSKRYDESIHDIAYHPLKPTFASGGADSVIKTYFTQ